MCNGIGFIVGLTMFGAIVYIPVYLQVVKDRTPTASGLLLLPLMVGVLFASIGSGRIISRIGKLKIFPIIGTTLTAISMLMLSRLQVDSSILYLAVTLVILGLGLGCVMQVLILAVQNAVDRKDMGAATSSVAFFRTLGGAFGTAIFGAVLTARLHYWEPKLLPGAAGKSGQLAGGATGCSATRR